MSVTTRTAPLVPVLPELDPALGDQLGDEILLGSAQTEKVAKVGGSAGGAFQSAQARAWTKGGQVD